MASHKREILNYINIFRGLAIILIVAGHSMCFGNPGTYLKKFVFEFFVGGTALFVFISGYLFQYLSDGFSYKNYLKKKLYNVISPYIITSVPGIILCLTIPALYRNPFDGLNPLLQVFVFYTTGYIHNLPTWYIPMTCLFFLMGGVFLYLAKKKFVGNLEILYCSLPILLLITILFHRFNVVYKDVQALNYLAKYFYYIKIWLVGFVHFLSVYVLGMFFAQYREKVDLLYKYKYFLLAGIILASVVDIYFIDYSNMNGTVSKVFLTLFILGILKHYDSDIKNCVNFNKILNVIAKYSFGIFFVHKYVIFIYNYLFHLNVYLPVRSLSMLGYIFSLAFIRFSVVLGCSFLICYLIKTGLNKLGIKNTRCIIGV